MYLKINTISIWTDKNGHKEVEPHPAIFLSLTKVISFQINDEIIGFEDIYFVCDGGISYYFSVNETRRDKNTITSKDSEFSITHDEFIRVKKLLNTLPDLSM